MTLRAILLTALATTLVPATAAASELRLSVGAGAAAAATLPCPSFDQGCVDPDLDARGAAPLVLAGVRSYRALGGSWRLRLGATASALLVAPGSAAGASVATGAGELGVERGRFAVDLIGGLSRVSVSEDEMSFSGATMMVGAAVTAKLTPAIALFARADLHAMMHGTVGGTFVGAGIEWTPSGD